MCLILHSSAKSHVMGSLSLLLLQGRARCMPISGRRSARRRPMIVSEGRPRSRWVPMGQQCGLPAARATKQEVLGAVRVWWTNSLSCGVVIGWSGGAVKRCCSAAHPNLAFRFLHPFRNYCANQSLTPDLAMLLAPTRIFAENAL
jgi:hypothetical protein